MSKITVFGGSGFLGSFVSDKLSEAGHEVTLFDKIASPWLRPDQQMKLGDILVEQVVDEAVQGAEFVYNFAGIADLDAAQHRPIDSVRFNVLGNTIVLEACRKANVRRYIFASSMYVYSRSGGFYRCSKQACELYIENYYETYGLPYTVLRYGTLYGPRSDTRNAIYRYVNQAFSEKKITYKGSPEAIREYIHVEDAARTSVEILKPEFENQHILITGQQQMKVRDLLKMIEEILGTPLQMEFLSPQNQAHYETTPYSFNPKIGKKFAPSIHIDLGQGLLRLIEEVYQQRHPELEQIQGYLITEKK